MKRILLFLSLVAGLLAQGQTTKVPNAQLSLTYPVILNNGDTLASMDFARGYSGGSAADVFYNITRYGASTASADNSSAINAAGAAASAAGGGIVFFPEGEWTVKAAYRDTATVVTPSGIHLYSNVIYQGAGAGTIIKLANSPTGATFTWNGWDEPPFFTTNTKWFNIFYGDSVSNVVIRDLTIDGNLDNQTNTTLDPYTNPSVYGLNQGANTGRNYQDSTVTNAIAFWKGDNNKVINVRVVGGPGYSVTFQNSTNGLITESYFTNCVNGGVGFLGTSEGGKMMFSTSTDHHGDGTRVQSNDIEILYNTFSNARENPTENPDFGGLYTEGASNVKIIGNKVFGNSGNGIDIQAVESLDDNANNIIVLHNEVDSNGAHGIYINCHNSILAHNSLRENGNGFVSHGRNNTFDNNTVTYATAAGRYFFWIDVSKNGNKYTNNKYIGGDDWFNLTLPPDDNTDFGNSSMLPDDTYTSGITAGGTVPRLTTPSLAVVGGTGEADLSWAAITNANRYKVELSLDNSTWTAAGSGYYSTTSATITGLAASTEYYFRLMAKDTNTQYLSSWYNVDSATTDAGGGGGGDVFDEFTDANGTSLASHTIAPTNEPGTSWTLGSGATMEIQSNKLKVDHFTSVVVQYATFDAGISDATASVIINTGAETQDMGLIFRYTDASNYWFILAEQSAGMFSIVERSAGTNTVRATTSKTFNQSTDYTLQVVLSGTSIIATVDGGSSINYTSSAGLSATRFGVWSAGGSSAVLGRFNDISVIE